jgi:hypothetical protein
MSRQGSQGLKTQQGMMMRKATSRGDLLPIDETGENNQVSSESRLLILRDAFLTTFEEMALSRTLGLGTFYFLQIVGLIQLLLLPLSPSPSMPWRSSSLDQSTRVSGGVEIVIAFHTFLLNVVLFPYIDGFGKLTSLPTFALWACTAFLSSSILVLFLWGIVRTLKGLPINRHSWRVGALCLLTSLATIALPVPIIANLLGPIACVSESSTQDISTGVSWASFVCWSPSHLGIFSFSLVLLTLTIGYMILSTLLLQTRSPDPKGSPTAVSYGRVETVAVIIKGILAAIYACGPGLNPWIHGAANLIGGIGLVFIYLRCLPFLSPRLNQFVIALNSIYLASAITCLFAIAVSAGSGPAFASAAGGLIWAFLCPIGVILGWSIGDARWRSIGKSADLSDVFIIELRLRWLLVEGLRLQACVLASGRSTNGGLKSLSDDNAHVIVPVASASSAPLSSLKGGGVSKGGGGGVCPMRAIDGDVSECEDGTLLPDGHPNPNASHGMSKTSTSKRIPTSRKPPPYGIFAGGLVVSNESTATNLRTITRLLDDALAAFPLNPMMHVFAAHVVRAANGNVYLESTHLRQATELSDFGSLDVHFYTRLRQTQLGEENRRALTGKMTVETRIYFESQMNIATQKVAACRTAILSFWTSLCDNNPDLVALQLKGSIIYQATREAEAVFRELLTLVPTSVPALRAYSEFLLEVTNNPGLATELMNDADQIEDEASKSQSMLKDVSEFEFGSVSTFDMAADGVALMTVSARHEADAFGGPSSLGVVTFGNSSCLRTLGYSSSRRELLGKEMSLLIPNPIAAIHSMYLSTFVLTGIQRLSGSSRSLFAIHRGGYIIPINAHVQATGDQWLVAFEEVPAPHIAFIWVMDEATGFRISAACRRALSLLGVSVASLRANSVSLVNYCSNVASMIARVQASPGSVIQLSGLPQRLGSRGQMQRSGSMQSVKSTRSNIATGAIGNYCAFVQELSVPLVSSSIFVIKLLAASETEIASAENMGYISRRVIDQDSDSDSVDENESLSSAIDETNDLLLPINRSESDTENDKDSIDIDSGIENMKKTTKKRHMKNEAIKKTKADSLFEKTSAATKKKTSNNFASKRELSSKRKLSVKPDVFGHVTDRPRFAVGFKEPMKNPPMQFATETEADLSLFQGVNEEEPSSRPESGSSLDKRTLPLHGTITSSLNQQPSSPVSGASTTVAFLPKQQDRSPARSTKSFKVPGIVALATVSPVHSGASQPRSVVKSGFQKPTLLAVNAELEKAHQIASPIRRLSPSKRKGAAISVSSGGSTGSRLMTTSEQIRTGVTLRSRRIEASLVRLRSAMLMVFVVVCITNIVSYVVTRVLTEKVLENLVEMREIAKVGTFVRRSVATIQLAVLANEGKYTYPDDLVWIRERIRTSVNSAEVAHRKLFRLAMSREIGPQVDAYLLPTLSSFNLLPGTYVDKDEFNQTEDKTSLSNLMLDYAVRMRSIWFFNLTQYNRNNEHIFWMLNTAGVPLVDALNASIFLAASSTASSDSVRLGNAVVLAVALAVFVFVALFVIVPATLEVVREQREVFDVFSAVPVKVIRHIRDRLSERITTLNRAAAGEEDGDIESTFPDDMHEDGGKDGGDDKDDASVESKNLRMRHVGGSLSLAVAQGVARDAKNASAKFDFEDDPKRAALARRRVILSSLFPCCIASSLSSSSNQKHGGTSRTRRKFAKNVSGFSSLLLQMLWPVVCFVAYYTGMYFQRSSVADMATSTRASMQWTVELEVLVPSVGFAFRNALLFHEPLFTEKWLTVLEERVNFLEYVVEAVAYGDNSMNLPSLITSSHGSSSLLIDNGCVDSTLTPNDCALGGKEPGCTYFYPISSCKKPVDSIDINNKVFASGVVGTGLLPGIQQLSRQIRTVIRGRKTSFKRDGGVYDEEDILDHGDELDVVNKLCATYLPAGLDALSGTVLEESTEMINLSMSIDILAVICSIIALIGFYLFLYAPLVLRLDNEIKRARFLLLLFPEEVAKLTPAVIEAGHKLVAGV